MINEGDIYRHDSNYYKITEVNHKEREVHIQNVDTNKSYDTDIRTFEDIFWSWYLQQKQRADELEHKLNKEIEESKRQTQRWYEELKRADELQDIIERFLYANRGSDIYAIRSEEELLYEYEKLNKI